MIMSKKNILKKTISTLDTKTTIEFNDRFLQALSLMEHSQQNVFVTGKAGTGKSTLLNYFRNTTKKKIVVLAPTGVAAINVHGQTIHSFFKFKPNVTIQKITKKERKSNKIYKNLDSIVIDEISMVRADLLDCIDAFLRLNGKNPKMPFGGIQMIFIGDLYQLPPVVSGSEKDLFKGHYLSPYFFDAKVFENFFMEFIELEKIYRQKDETFIKLLNSIRNNTVCEEELIELNKQLKPDFENNDKDNFYIYLTTTNDMAEKINNNYLLKLKNPTHLYNGEIKGTFDSKQLPASPDFCVKVGAQVMLLNNDSLGRWVNGSLGRVVEIESSEEYDYNFINVELTDGTIVDVLPHTWEIFNFQFNDKANIIETKTIGSFTQYPLKLAWAVTIHKSQGKTFEKVIIDIGKGTFAHGQMYVALSRCTTLEGIILKKAIEKKHIIMDWRVIRFVTKYQYQISERNCPFQDKLNIIKEAINKKTRLEILYLKPSDEKSRRVILPKYVGEMEYLGKKYIGLEGFCFSQNGKRVFRIDRILELNQIDVE